MTRRGAASHGDGDGGGVDPDHVEPVRVRVHCDGGEAGVGPVREVASPGEGGQELRVLVTRVVTVQTEVRPLPRIALEFDNFYFDVHRYASVRSHPPP